MNPQIKSFAKQKIEDRPTNCSIEQKYIQDISLNTHISLKSSTVNMFHNIGIKTPSISDVSTPKLSRKKFLQNCQSEQCKSLFQLSSKILVNPDILDDSIPLHYNLDTSNSYHDTNNASTTLPCPHHLTTPNISDLTKGNSKNSPDAVKIKLFDDDLNELHGNLNANVVQSTPKFDYLKNTQFSIGQTPGLNAQSENNGQLSPDCITDTSKVSENNGTLSPECITFDTPNSSELENCSDDFSESLLLSHGSLEGIHEKSKLDHKASPFVPIQIESDSPTGRYIDQDSPYTILRDLRLKNVQKIIIGHININSIRNKFDLLADLIKDKIDIMLISETKLDDSFPKSQFVLQGYSSPFRLDRTANGGGLLLYLRNDIPAKPLPLIDGNIECIISDITISKKKWLLIGTYNPNKALISSHLIMIRKSLGHYVSSFDNVIIFGDFNCQVGEEPMSDFCNSFGLKSLIKVPTCFKSAENPSCIDLILTNRPYCFQNTIVLETGLSDFHKLTATVMKTSFSKKPAKIIKYRDYKNYSAFNFQNEVNFHLAGIDLNVISNDEYISLLMEVLSRHAPIKTKHLRANDQPFMTKELRKEHMKRSRLRNIYLNNRNEANAMAYKRQRNMCVFLLKNAKKTYFGNLKPSKISDNKNFWKTVNPLFSEKGVSTDKITLIENKGIVSDDKHVAEIFNDFFSNAVKNLNIDYYEHFSFDKYFLCKDTEENDPILKAIEKYENHPSILKINETTSRNECFHFKHTDLKSVITEINNLNESKSSPIESMPAKVLKDISDTLAPKIVTDFNLSVTTGSFPQKQKLADVTPIFKKEDKLPSSQYLAGLIEDF